MLLRAGWGIGFTADYDWPRIIIAELMRHSGDGIALWCSSLDSYSAEANAAF